MEANDIKTILDEANSRFFKFQDDLSKRVDDLQKEKEEKMHQKIVIDEENTPKEYRDRLNKCREQLRSIASVQKFCESMKNVCETELEITNGIYSFNPMFENVATFISYVDCFGIPDMRKDTYQLFRQAQKIYKIEYTVKTSTIQDLNTKLNRVYGIHTIYCSDDRQSYKTDTSFVVNKIRSVLGDKEAFINFFNETISFMNKMYKLSEKSKDEYIEMYNKCIEEIKKLKIDEIKQPINEKIDLLTKLNNQCKDVVEFGTIYNYDPTQENLNKLASALKTLELISNREYRILTHEKVDDVEEETEEETIQTPEVITKTPNKLELDYFGDKNSNCVICFLGENGNDILYDLNNSLEKPARIQALSELSRIFKGYIEEKDFYVEFGKGPSKSEENDKVNALLESPYNFNYRRIGTSHDPFRIHAIHRYSKLLNELGFGTGNIMFFGAIGPVFDDTKGPTYQKVGKRTIDAIGYNNQESKLNSSFDTIEHITRRYIPAFLLSDDDKKRVKEGKFSSKDKATGKNRSIGDKEYFLFDSLDDNSKNNVITYLKRYFTIQSQYMFNIMKEYDDIKDKSFN
ncbi:MAG: hypothetical protein IKZ96_02510 [Bacilli bacterium]|nr:hypothetical protein [Bacilli bacterium]